MTTKGKKPAPPPRTSKQKVKNVNKVERVSRVATRRLGGQRGSMVSGGNALGNYKLALVSPFTDQALGARVPDMNSAPTVTFHTKGIVSLNSGPGGVSSLVITANPYLSMIDMNTTTVGTTSMFNYAAGATTVSAAISLANMQNAFSAVRVVGVGIRLRNLLPPTTATGRLYVAPFCYSGSQPGPNLLAGAAMVNWQVAEYISVPCTTTSTTAGVLSSLVELPGSQEYTMQDLITSGVEVWLKPVSPEAFTFHNTYNFTGGLTGTVVQSSGETTSNAGTGVVAGGTSDTTSCANWGGFEGLLIRAEGMPFNTVALDMEYIYHLEGTPAVSQNTGGGLIPTAPAASFVDLNGFNSVLSEALTRPVINLVQSGIDMGMANAHRITPFLLNTMMARMGLSV